jgi:hypothetical protein
VTRTIYLIALSLGTFHFMAVILLAKPAIATKPVPHIVSSPLQSMHEIHKTVRIYQKFRAHTN